MTFAREFAYAGLAFVIFGAALFTKSDRAQAIGLLLIAVAGPVFALGFRDESDTPRYLLESFAVCSIFAGVAIAWCLSRGAVMKWSTLVATALLMIALVLQGRVLFGQPHDARARRDVNEVLARTPNDAILISTWVLSPALAYAAYVDRSTGARTIVPSWYGDTEERIGAWRLRRPVFVVGTPEGSVAGLRLERLASHTEIYRVVHE